MELCVSGVVCEWSCVCVDKFCVSKLRVDKLCV